MSLLHITPEIAHDLIDAEIQKLVSPQQYRTWFHSLKVLSVADGQVLFSVSNDFHREWIRRNYSGVLDQVLHSAFSAPVKYSIVTADPPGDGPARPAPHPNPCAAAAQTRPLNQSLGPSGFRLNPKYTFENFITGPSNQLAYAASLAVADSPSKTYNPLFIHGSVGLGKTHLLQAICHKRMQAAPGDRILYLSCETFINQFISAIEKGNVHTFRNRYRDIDILLIDDIYLIANKERTQEEFFHTFNSLYNAGKQIILSSDSPPSEIPTLEERLVSRFKWGLVVQIESPDFETRYAILRAKARNMGHEVPHEVLSFLTECVNTNIRELEGSITKVIGYSSLLNVPLDLSVAETAMRDVLKKPRAYTTIEDIVRAVTKVYNVKLADLQSKKRAQSITLPRQVCMYIAKLKTTLSLQEIGGFFGGRDHTTVLHASEKIKREVSMGGAVACSVQTVLQQLDT